MSEFLICNECNGKGITITPKDQSPPKFKWYYCSKCKGSGRLNWIENIFGKRPWLIKEDKILRTENTQRYLRGEYR